MNSLPSFPIQIHRYVSKVFADANRRLCEKIARVPNCSEPSLDMTLVEHLSQHSGPRVVAPGWAVRIDSHYLGGMRHFYGWEIADIGLLLFAKQGGTVVSKKVALLQSKRLYPIQHGVDEESEDDYRIGFGRLLPGSSLMPSIVHPHTFDFNKESKYKALRVGDHQYSAIEEYESKRKIPVHYLLYNPWKLPCSYHFPVTPWPMLRKRENGGARVISSTQMRAKLSGKPKGASPSFGDIEKAVSSASDHLHGWRLEHFVSERFMKCKEGQLFEDLKDENIFALFNRRSGPIAAAVAVTIEQLDPEKR
jgi:hypothetical protein